MRNLGKEGLSMSDAQSLSNLCNQKAENINKKFKSYGLYDKYFGDVIIYKTKKIPYDVDKLLEEKARLHSFQAYLMDAMKRKDQLIEEEKDKEFVFNVEKPENPKYELEPSLILVDEEWGFDQLTDEEYNEYLDNEAHAAHIGQFIHKNSILENFRSQVHNIPSIEWFEQKKDEKSIITISQHHQVDFYDELHNKLANVHRNYEKKVNYIKAKVKNLVSEENQKRISQHKIDVEDVNNKNAILKQEYDKKINDWNHKYKSSLSDSKVNKI